MGIKENIKQLQEDIIHAAKNCNRNPEDIKLIAVSKTFDESCIKEANEAGLKTFGENRIQEAEPKITNLSDTNIEWHLIGHLQSNKAKKAVALFEFIHSIDKIKTMQKINEESKKISKNQKVLIQINTSHEETKSGINPEETMEFIEQIKDLTNINICGLMTIGPFTNDEAAIKSSFLKLKTIFDECKDKFPELNFQYLSMGMTNDYKIALECGSNMIRVGRKIFGTR